MSETPTGSTRLDGALRAAAESAERGTTLTLAGVDQRVRRLRRRRVASGATAAAVLLVAAGATGYAVTRPSGGVPPAASASPGPTPPSLTALPTRPPQPAPTPLTSADVDGDGRPDTIALRGDQVVVTGTSAGTLTVRLPHPGKLQVAAVADVEAGNRADLWVRVSTRGHAAFYALLRYDGTRLAAVTTAGDGAPWLVGLGADGDTRYEMSCVPGGGQLLVRTGSSTDGVVYTGTLTRYRLAGDAVVAVAPPSPASWSPGSATDLLAGQPGCGIR